MSGLLGLFTAYPLTLLLAHCSQYLLPNTLRPAKLCRQLWLLQTTIITIIYLLALILSLRPYLSTVITLAFLAILLVINQAKHHALREPLVFSDIHLYLQVIKHPRLFLPFLNIPLAAGSVIAGMALLYAAIQIETSLLATADLHPIFFYLTVLLALGYCAYLTQRLSEKFTLTFEAQRDVHTFGFYNSLIIYTLQAHNKKRLAAFQQLLVEKSPFQNDTKSILTDQKDIPSAQKLADIIVIQSESFFDPRPMWSGIKPTVLKTFDHACATAVAHGSLNVPAWGANTLRTEFAFLSGIANHELKHYHFNPYQYLRKHSFPTLVSHLKSNGYHCIAIHPNAADFFQRNKVFPLMGFDEFIDIDAFNKNDTDGPYISDAAVSKKINAVLERHNNEQPLFVFIITMENHGPLHLEPTTAKHTNNLYHEQPSFEHHDLSVYLRHLNNADVMLKTQLEALKNRKRTTILSFYGDHVPSMPEVYSQLGFQNPQTRFLVWSNA